MTSFGTPMRWPAPMRARRGYGTTFEQIDASGVEAWLAGLREDLVSKKYRPDRYGG